MTENVAENGEANFVSYIQSEEKRNVHQIIISACSIIFYFLLQDPTVKRNGSILPLEVLQVFCLLK